MKNTLVLAFIFAFSASLISCSRKNVSNAENSNMIESNDAQGLDHQAATSHTDRFINFIAAFPEQRPPLDLSEMPNAGKIDSLWVVRYIDPDYPKTLEKEWEAAQKEDGGESYFELQYFHSARVLISADYYTVVYFQMRQGIGPTGLLAIANYSTDGKRIDQIDLEVGEIYIDQTVKAIIEEFGIRVNGKIMYNFGPDGMFRKE